MKLTDEFDDRLEYEGHVLNVNMAFDNILLLFEMFDDEAFFEVEKVPMGLEMLIHEYDLIRGKPYEEQFALFKFVMKEFLDIDLDGEQHESKKIMDFQKDAGLIYASFFAVYKMDLFELRGKLHWRKFQTLLTHLQDNSPLKQVIGYRTMKVPDAKTSSEEYRQHVMDMKRIHALEDQNPMGAMDQLEHFFRGEAKQNV